MFSKKITIRYSTIILIILIIAFIGVAYYFFTKEYKNPDDTSSIKNLSILSSAVVGLFVAIIQYLIQLYEIRSYEKTSSLKIKDVLYTRNDKNYYASFIKKASKEICIMGVTGSRFINDFGDLDVTAQEEARILIDLLKRNVKVRILLPEKDYLTPDDKLKEQQASAKYETIKSRYENFEIRYFNHLPSHSIFKVDSECIVGPVFPNVSSRNTPAIHMENSSKLVESYLEYFDKEWKEAHE